MADSHLLEILGFLQTADNIHLLAIDSADEHSYDCCCGEDCDCCLCENPSSYFCCVGADDTMDFEVEWDAATFDVEVCDDDNSTNTCTINYSLDQETYQFLLCDDTLVVWVLNVLNSCLPPTIIQPCDPGDPWLFINEDGSDWVPSQCVDSSCVDNTPELCQSVQTCTLTPDCCCSTCAGAGGHAPNNTPGFVELDTCCFEVSPNNCDELEVNWWCFVCDWDGTAWSEVCVHYRYEAVPNYVTCDYKTSIAECVCL